MSELEAMIEQLMSAGYRVVSPEEQDSLSWGEHGIMDGFQLPTPEEKACPFEYESGIDYSTVETADLIHRLIQDCDLVGVWSGYALPFFQNDLTAISLELCEVAMRIARRRNDVRDEIVKRLGITMPPPLYTYATINTLDTAPTAAPAEATGEGTT